MALVTRKNGKQPRLLAQVTHDGAGLHCPKCGAAEALVGNDRQAVMRQIAAFHARHARCLKPYLDQAREALFRRLVERSHG